MKCIVGSSGRQKQATRAAVATILLLVTVLAGEARCAHRLVGQEKAGRLGLTRAWFTQVRLDSARSHVERAVLEGDHLTVLTSAGVVQELNALTGETYWLAPIGNENYPSLGPAGNDKYVAIVNGSTLYVLDRKNGKAVFVRSVGGAPGAAPAVAEKYVFVPLVSGKVEGYGLSEQKLTPWYYQSYGKAMVPPRATAESVVWTTDAGYLYVANSKIPGMRFRLETGSDIVASPAYNKPYLCVASNSGDVFSMHELSGDRRWKYATGFPVTRAPAAVGDRVFVTTDEPALHCIDAKTGNRLWEVPHMNQFAAVSKERVYGGDDLGAFVVLNATNGATIARVPGDHSTDALVNDQTDRIYLVSDDGLIECFHEIGLTHPIVHNPKPVETAKDKEAAPAEKSSAPAAKPAESSAKPPAKAKATKAEEKPKAEEKKPDKKSGFGVEENPF